MNHSRRRLLMAAGATAAFGALLSAQSLAHAQSLRYSLDELRSLWRTRLGHGPASRSVAIIGAGISGLVAAYELQRLGLQPVVFEATGRPGGRIETLRADSWIQEQQGETQHCRFHRDRDLYFNTGPARISQAHTRVLGYCRELSVELELINNENKAGYFRVAALARRGPMRLRQFQASLRGGIAEMLAKNLAAGNSQGVIPAAEIPGMLAMLTQFGDLDRELRFTGSPRGGVVEGSDPMHAATPLSPLELRELARMDFFSQYKMHLGEYLDQQASTLQPRHGMDHFSQALYHRVGQRVLLNCPVTALERHGGQALVRFTRNGQSAAMAFSRVIVTTSPLLAARWGRDFSPQVLAALQSHRMSRPAKVAFQAPRFWETQDGIYGGVSYTDDDITMLWYPSHALGSAQGILVGAYHTGTFPQDRFGDLPAAQRIRLALEQGEKIHPGYGRMVSAGISRSWSRAPYFEGGWSVSEPAPLLQRPDGPFLFAGDYLSRMPGWMEGAIASSHAALSQL